GLTRKEFLKNLAGNFIIINNVSNEVKGTTTTTDGYRGSIPVTVIPKQISVDADNGITYDIEDWFSFSASSLYLRLQASFPGFHNLLKKAGLTQDNLNRYTFVSDNEFYTIFAPTDEALNSSGADTLSIEELKKFLRFHFVQGDFIFTDGIQPSGYYETARVDEKSTAFSTVFTELYIDPGYDIIVLPDKNGGQYLAVNESSVTNMLTGRSVGEGGTSAFPNVINTAVVHGINKVFLMEELNTR
ncbi:MAG: fasciclin domain-containing protein, partial [Bacteroidales bacterium]|nr:fasciclin domain-containing protein [Bacteroidales bacterium]